MKKKLYVLSLTLVACACQQAQVEVPTTKELTADPKLLAEWQQKCDGGEYAHLPADKKQNFCFTTGEARRVIAAKKAAAEEQDFYDANTLRKK